MQATATVQPYFTTKKWYDKGSRLAQLRVEELESLRKESSFYLRPEYAHLPAPWLKVIKEIVSQVEAAQSHVAEMIESLESLAQLQVATENSILEYLGAMEDGEKGAELKGADYTLEDAWPLVEKAFQPFEQFGK